MNKLKRPKDYLFFSDRIETTSFGGLTPRQTLEGFSRGRSIPVNKELSDIFMQLHLSEKTGCDVPTIIHNYSMNAFEFNDNAITVILKLNRVNVFSNDKTKETEDEVGNKVGNKINSTESKIIPEMKNNPSVTISDLSLLLGLSNKTIEKSISHLKSSEIIVRRGSRKAGYWLAKENKAENQD